LSAGGGVPTIQPSVVGSVARASDKSTGALANTSVVADEKPEASAASATVLRPMSEFRNFIFAETPQISHARRAHEPSLLNNRAMWSVNMIGELRDIKGVALWFGSFIAFFICESWC
jgi:hypothetical protein